MFVGVSIESIKSIHGSDPNKPGFIAVEIVYLVVAEIAGNIATGELYLAGLCKAPFSKAKAEKKYKQSNNRHITSSSSSNFLLLGETAKFGLIKMTMVKRKKQ